MRYILPVLYFVFVSTCMLLAAKDIAIVGIKTSSVKVSRIETVRRVEGLLDRGRTQLTNLKVECPCLICVETIDTVILNFPYAFPCLAFPYLPLR